MKAIRQTFRTLIHADRHEQSFTSLPTPDDVYTTWRTTVHNGDLIIIWKWKARVRLSGTGAQRAVNFHVGGGAKVARPRAPSRQARLMANSIVTLASHRSPARPGQAPAQWAGRPDPLSDRPGTPPLRSVALLCGCSYIDSLTPPSQQQRPGASSRSRRSHARTASNLRLFVCLCVTVIFSFQNIDKM